MKIQAIARYGWVGIALIALTCGASVYGDAIRAAAQTDDVEKVRALLTSNPALVNSQDKVDGAFPLHMAALHGRTAVVELLLQFRAQVDALDHYGQTALHMAAINGQKEVVQVLLAHRANFNAKSKGGETPLQLAALNGHPDVVELLVSAGAFVDIFEASACGDVERVKTMVGSHPGWVNGANNSGKTALHYAAQFGRKEVVEFLLASKASVDARDKMGQTPLHLAKSREVSDLLLDNKADVNARDHQGCTPLLLAAYQSEQDVLESLLNHKADVDAKDSNGQTALHCAAVRGRKDIALMLLKNNAQINARDNQNQTPLHFALVAKDKDLADTLRQHGGTE